MSDQKKENLNEMYPNFLLYLTEPSQFPKEILLDLDNKDELGSLICSFASAVNDLKDLASYNMVIADVSASGQELKFHQKGQLSGMNWYIAKLYIGLLHELFKLISEKMHIIESDEFKSILKKMKSQPEAVSSWDFLVSVVKEKNSRSDYKKLFSVLTKIRNNFSFHFNQSNEMIRSYRKHQAQNAGKKEAEFLYASIGGSLQQTRFYFVDGIIEAYIMNLLEETYKDFNEFVNSLMPVINRSLRPIVSEYLIIRGKEIKQK